MTQVSKINGISIPNTSITGYTYDGVNTFTISQNDGVSFTASINVLSATTFNGVTFSGGTFYGDGSNLTGIVGVSDTYTTGATFTNNIITFTNNTGGTYTVLLNNFSGLTVNGDTNTTGNILSGGTNIDTLFTTDAFTTFSSTTAGEGSVVAVTKNDQINFSGINVNILTNDTDKTITLSADTGGSFNSFDITDGSVTETINDGDTITFSTNSGITATVSATDTVTFDLDITGTTAEGSPSNGDKLLIWEAGSGTHRNIDWNQLPGSGGGESNTASNVGGANGLFYQKSGVDLQFRSLSAGTNITITSGETTLTINSTATGGGGSSRTTGSTQTTNATPATGDTISTLTDNNTNIIEVYVKAYVASAANWGVWKRTLTVTSVSGTVVIREVNADVDKTSAGLNANSVDFEVSGSNINILLTGIAGTTVDWETSYEIIL